MKTKPPIARPFWLNLLLILGTVTLIALIGGTLIGGLAMISNLYFIGAVVLWIIAVIPIFTEVGGNTRITIKARRAGENPKELIQAEEGKYKRGSRITYLYGLSGFICFVLAIIVLTV